MGELLETGKGRTKSGPAVRERDASLLYLYISILWSPAGCKVRKTAFFGSERFFENDTDLQETDPQISQITQIWDEAGDALFNL
jgi:hypothetical protein